VRTTNSFTNKPTNRPTNQPTKVIIMGAGCNYTLDENNDIRAYWIDIACDCYEQDQECVCFQDTIDNLKYELLELKQLAKHGQVPSNNGYENKFYYLDSYIVSLESTYNGDGVLIQFLLQDDSDNYGLKMHNYENSYLKVIKHINKYYPLRIATSGYTSAFIDVGKAFNNK
jgi:hypothetical protein